MNRTGATCVSDNYLGNQLIPFLVTAYIYPYLDRLENK